MNFLTKTRTITPQNTDVSSWITLYIWTFVIQILPLCQFYPQQAALFLCLVVQRSSYVILLHQHFFFHLVNHVISGFNICCVAKVCSAVRVPRVTFCTPVFQLRNSFRSLPTDMYCLLISRRTVRTKWHITFFEKEVSHLLSNALLLLCTIFLQVCIMNSEVACWVRGKKLKQMPSWKGFNFVFLFFLSSHIFFTSSASIRTNCFYVGIQCNSQKHTKFH